MYFVVNDFFIFHVIHVSEEKDKTLELFSRGCCRPGAVTTLFQQLGARHLPRQSPNLQREALYRQNLPHLTNLGAMVLIFTVNLPIKPITVHG